MFGEILVKSPQSYKESVPQDAMPRAPGAAAPADAPGRDREEKKARRRLGNFACQYFDICLRNSCGSFAENRGDLRRLSFSPEMNKYCGDLWRRRIRAKLRR